MSDEQAYEEGYRWLYKILRDAGYDPNMENPEAFAKRTRIAEEENERLRAQVDTLTDVIERMGTAAEARIDAALAIAGNDPDRVLAAVVKALKGEK